MNKRLITSKTELKQLILDCYKTDLPFLVDYHELASDSLSDCVDRTFHDFTLCNVVINVLEDNNTCFGYFGCLNQNGQNWLTGFFLKPEYRTSEHKRNMWNIITNHLQHSFKVGMLVKNERASKFLLKNGCEFSHYEPSLDVLGKIFTYNHKEIA